jgi:hypothetical protein
MDKYIGTVFLLNESIAFVVVEPLNGSIVHMNILLSQNFNVLTGG